MKKQLFKRLGFLGLLTFFLLIGALRIYAQEPGQDAKRFGFGFGFNIYRGMDSRFSGNGNIFLLTFKLSEDFDISLLREEFKMNGSGAPAGGGKIDVDVNCSVTGIRVMRRVANYLHIGIDIGNASYSNGFADSSLMAGFLATITTLQSQDKFFHTKLDIDLGYRLLNTDNKDVFNNPSSLVTNLDSFTIGMSFKVLF
jgi:hypothetical protein